MTFNKLPSIFKQLRPVSIGFDNLFDHFENFFDDDQFFRSSLTSTFPFYNIVKKGDNKYDIELALSRLRQEGHFGRVCGKLVAYKVDQGN